MSPIIIYNNRLLMVDVKLTTDPACCCKNDSESVACCFWYCEYYGEPYWPDIEDPENVPDITEYSDAMIAAGWSFGDGGSVGWWWKGIYGVENCDDEDVAAQTIQDLEAEITGIVGNLGGFGFVFLADFAAGPACIEADQQYCEENLLGTFHAGKACADNPCCSKSCDENEEHPCYSRTRVTPGGMPYVSTATGWDCDCVDGECAPAPVAGECCTEIWTSFVGESNDCPEGYTLNNLNEDGTATCIKKTPINDPSECDFGGGIVPNMPVPEGVYSWVSQLCEENPLP